MPPRHRLPAGHDTLDQILFSQGHGARRECEGLILAGRVSINGEVVDDPDSAWPTEGLRYTVEGQEWVYHAKALIVLNKPSGYECSLKPGAWPGVHNLLPLPLRRRGLQPVGRLDQDTTGLLLMTDDGPLVHKLTSPKHHVPKVYEATTKHPITQAQCDKLLSGVVLEDDPKPVKAEGAEIAGEYLLRLTLTEGKYHQVKRMVAAVSNRVEALHRSRIGELTLPADMAPGQWRWIDDPAIVLPQRGDKRG
jgi:16S rRNA pseudouridine516 synthase